MVMKMISYSPKRPCGLIAFNLVKSRDCIPHFTLQLLYRDLRHMTLLSPRCLECVAGYVKMVIKESYNVPETFQLFNKPPPADEGFIRDIVLLKNLKIEF